ncbi:MAG: oligosaccharide flippase family protein [Fulvivirga sp.]|nr:oligosaccharide flippase family protein [Fulvivirga sp.]
MGLVRKHSINFTFIYYIGVVLGYVNTVLLFPNILEPDQFGLTRILLSIAIVISQFAQLGSPNMVIRYFPVLRKKIFSLGILICTTGLVVVLSLLILLQQPIKSFFIDNSALFTDHFYLLLPFGAAMVYYNLFDAYLRAIYKNAFSAFLSNILVRLIWMALILIYSFGHINFQSFIVLFACSYALITLISFIYIQIVNNPRIINQFSSEEKEFFKQIRSFNFFTLLAGISSFLINKVDIMMLGSMESLEVLGVYAIAAYMAMVIRVPASSIARTAQVLVADSFKKSNIRDVASLYTKSAITQLILSSGIFILILINYQNITYVLPETFRQSYYIFLFLGITQVLDSAMGINGFIMINSKYYKTETLFSTLLLVLTVISNLILIPLMGAQGAAIATLFSIAAYNLMRLFFIRQKLKMQPFTVKTLYAILIGGTTFFLSNLVPVYDHFIIDAIIRSAVMCILFVPLVYFSKISPDVNKMIDGIMIALRK